MFGGLWSKAIWFLFGVLLSALALTGAYLHVQRLRSGGSRSRWSGTTSAMLVSAVLLVVAAWGGWRELVGYGPIVDGLQIAPQVPPAVALFLGGWVALTIGVLAAWAWFVSNARRP